MRWDSPARLLKPGNRQSDDQSSRASHSGQAENPLSWLSETEHRRLASVSHVRTREQMAAARVLLRKTLAEQNPDTSPASWIVGRDEEGAPWVSHPDIETPPHVSMTHTDGLVAVALDSDRCGVDVEHSERAVSSRRLAKRYFPAREFDELSMLSEAELHREFILRWTVREAWTKAERSTFLDALKRCETVRKASGRLDLLVAKDSHVTTGHIFSDLVEGYVITALSRHDACDSLRPLGRVLKNVAFGH